LYSPSNRKCQPIARRSARRQKTRGDHLLVAVATISARTVPPRPAYRMAIGNGRWLMESVRVSRAVRRRRRVCVGGEVVAEETYPPAPLPEGKG